MNELQNLGAATIMALASVFSGFGAGAMFTWCFGSDTKARRLQAILVGLISALVMMNAQIWFGYHGFKI